MSIEIELRQFRKHHINLTFEWISDPVHRHLFLMRGKPDWESHVSYWNCAIWDRTQKIYAVQCNGIHIGNCGFKNIINSSEGELWIYIGDKRFRGKGVGTVATKLLIEEGFARLGFQLIYLHVADFNIPAYTIYKKLGFTDVLLHGNVTDWNDRGCKIIRMELKRSRA